MTVLILIVLIFSTLGAVDYVIGNKLGVGAEFERAFKLFSAMALSMIGMIVLAPAIAELLKPTLGFFSDFLHLDPSILPAMLLANDMGGAPLASQVALDEKIGMFNGLVVSSMMGCTVSFTIPFALGLVAKENHKQLCLGLLCGVVTIPIGCLIGGVMCRIPILTLLLDLLPLIIFSVFIAIALLFFPNACVKVFKVFGFAVNALIILGLMLGIYNFLVAKITPVEIGGRSLDIPPIPVIDTVEEGAMVCLNASIVMTGMFPLVTLVSRLLNKPLKALGARLGIDEKSAIGIVASLATSATSFGMMNQMNKKGMMVNSAFAVAGAFTFCSHMAFTMAFPGGKDYLAPMIVGKLVSGAASLGLSFMLYPDQREHQGLLQDHQRYLRGRCRHRLYLARLGRPHGIR